MMKLYKLTVKLPPNETPEAIEDNPKWFPYFMDCRGAIDGSFIPISVKNLKNADARVPWRCRKNFYAQNVMAAVDFDMNFVYILPGWEGSAHDGKVLRSALEKGFEVPDGCYYLADAGYGSNIGLVLTPYQRVRYHLKEWEKVGQKPQNKEELFNLRHSSARNVVERTFGVFKQRFKILRSGGRDGFSIQTQVKLVYALAALHNFLNSHGSDPEEEADELERLGLLEYDSDPSPQSPDDIDYIDDRGMTVRRDEIAEMMWEQWGDIVRGRAENH